MKNSVSDTHFYSALNDRAPFFLMLGVNFGTVRVGGDLSFRIAFSRA